jgi:hypothetical protein
MIDVSRIKVNRLPEELRNNVGAACQATVNSLHFLLQRQLSGSLWQEN